MIVGDLNTTLNPVLDRKKYKTDNHKKSRMVINNWISENKIIYFYRFKNGNEQIWTYSVKESHDQTLKGRIDYVLGTPNLSNAISDGKHIFHAISFFSIDFAPENKGPGVFRAHPALLKTMIMSTSLKR